MAIDGKYPDKNYFIPLFRWFSGHRPNIDYIQKINRKIFKISKKDILMHELVLSNTLKRFIAYPKAYKDDKNLNFFFNDLCKFYGWTRRELDLNKNVIDIENLKPIIARHYGYNNKQRKALDLKEIGLKNFI